VASIFFLLKKILVTGAACSAGGGAMLWFGLFPTDFKQTADLLSSFW